MKYHKSITLFIMFVIIVFVCIYLSSENDVGTKNHK